jgi:predicted tellurium resistance membrane protein TerC/CBS domain-containing protein
MSWLVDPTIWVGLVTLILLEIVLSVDNLIFVAILSAKLPPDRRDRARQLGLGLALVMRLVLLTGIFWLTTLTAPLFRLLDLEFSGRDLILILGGFFLLLKATVEIHERLEGQSQEPDSASAYAGFVSAVVQIVPLDAVFSLDSILTAVGMTDQLGVMMAAVIVAMAIMVAASKPLTEFTNAHPPLVILCLGFLLMIGLSLIADGLRYHIPKGYLYAAIGFAVMIEIFNRVSSRNRQRRTGEFTRRQNLAAAALRLLGGIPTTAVVDDGKHKSLVAKGEKDEVFAEAEREMVRSVLSLADRPITSIMPPRSQLFWINLDHAVETIVTEIRNTSHAQLLVCRGSVDQVVGAVRKQDLLDVYLESEKVDVAAAVREALVVLETTSILETLELFKLGLVHLVIVKDDRGRLQGILTHTDLWKAIAGDLPVHYTNVKLRCDDTKTNCLPQLTCRRSRTATG